MDEHPASATTTDTRSHESRPVHRPVRIELSEGTTSMTPVLTDVLQSPRIADRGPLCQEEMRIDKTTIS